MKTTGDELTKTDHDFRDLAGRRLKLHKQVIRMPLGYNSKTLVRREEDWTQQLRLCAQKLATAVGVDLNRIMWCDRAVPVTDDAAGKLGRPILFKGMACSVFIDNLCLLVPCDSLGKHDRVFTMAEMKGTSRRNEALPNLRPWVRDQLLDCLGAESVAGLFVQSAQFQLVPRFTETLEEYRVPFQRFKLRLSEVPLEAAEKLVSFFDGQEQEGNPASAVFRLFDCDTTIDLFGTPDIAMVRAVLESEGLVIKDLDCTPYMLRVYGGYQQEGSRYAATNFCVYNKVVAVNSLPKDGIISKSLSTFDHMHIRRDHGAFTKTWAVNEDGSFKDPSPTTPRMMNAKLHHPLVRQHGWTRIEVSFKAEGERLCPQWSAAGRRKLLERLADWLRPCIKSVSVAEHFAALAGAPGVSVAIIDPTVNPAQARRKKEAAEQIAEAAKARRRQAALSGEVDLNAPLGDEAPEKKTSSTSWMFVDHQHVVSHHGGGDRSTTKTYLHGTMGACSPIEADETEYVVANGDDSMTRLLEYFTFGAPHKPMLIGVVTNGYGDRFCGEHRTAASADPVLLRFMLVEHCPNSHFKGMVHTTVRRQWDVRKWTFPGVINSWEDVFTMVRHAQTNKVAAHSVADNKVYPLCDMADAKQKTDLFWTKNQAKYHANVRNCPHDALSALLDALNLDISENIAKNTKRTRGAAAAAVDDDPTLRRNTMLKVKRRKLRHGEVWLDAKGAKGIAALPAGPFRQIEHVQVNPTAKGDHRVYIRVGAETYTIPAQYRERFVARRTAAGDFIKRTGALLKDPNSRRRYESLEFQTPTIRAQTS